MGDFFSSLASERTPITTFFTLVVFCILLIITWPASRYPYKISKKNRIQAYWLILIYFVFAMNDGDWFHLYNLFKEPTFRSREASDITSQSAGLEAAYYSIARFVDYNYIAFRIIVWGGTSIICYVLGKRLGINKSLFLFFYTIIVLDVFSFQRGALAMALGFWGYSYIVKPNNRHRVLSFIWGILLIYISTFFHKSAYFFFPVFLLSFFRFNKQMFIVLLLAAPVVVYLADSYLANYLLNMGTDSTALNATVLQGYLTVENRHFGIGSILRNIILPLMFLTLFIYTVKQVIFKQIKLPDYILRYFNCSFIIIIIAFLLLTIRTVNVSIFYIRLLYFSALPLSIVVTFIYSSYKHNKISNWFIVVCVICSLYKIILNLLGAIFLGEDGRT